MTYCWTMSRRKNEIRQGEATQHGLRDSLRAFESHFSKGDEKNMGRTEKRQRERSERIADRKEKILLTPQELRQIKLDIAQQVSKFDVDALLTCFAQVLYSEFQWEYDDIIRALTAVDITFGKVLRDELSVKDMQKQLEDDLSLRIVSD